LGGTDRRWCRIDGCSGDEEVRAKWRWKKLLLADRKRSCRKEIVPERDRAGKRSCRKEIVPEEASQTEEGVIT
jgi:hypothetical protein